MAKGAFGCIRSESPAEKDAFLPNLVRVYGFIKARACAIWRLQNSNELEALFQTDAKAFSSEAS